MFVVIPAKLKPSLKLPTGLLVATLFNLAVLISLARPEEGQAAPVLVVPTAPSYYYFSFEITLQTQTSAGSVPLAKAQEQELASIASKWRLEFRGNNQAFAGKSLPVNPSGSDNTTNPTLAVYRLLSRLDLAQKSGQLVLVDGSGAIVGSQQLDWNSPGDYNLTGSFILKVTGDGVSAAGAGAGSAEFDKTRYQLKGGLHSWATSLVTQLSNQMATHSPTVTLAGATATPISTTPNPDKSSSSSTGSPVTTETTPSSTPTPTRTVRRGGNPVLLIILTLLFWGLGIVLLVHAFQVGLFRFSFRAAGTSASLVMPKEREQGKGKRQSKGKETSPLDLLPKQKQKQKAGQAVASLPGENNEATSQPIRGTNQAISNSELNLKLVVTPPVGAATSLLSELDEVQMPPNQNQISLAVPVAVSAGKPQQRDEIDGPTITSKQNQAIKINPAGAGSEEALNQSELELIQEVRGGQVGYISSVSIPATSDSPNLTLTAQTQTQGQVESAAPEPMQKTVLFTGNLKKLDSEFERDALNTLLKNNAVGYWLSADKVEIKNQVYLKDLAKALWSTTGSTGFGSAESAFMGNDSRLDFLLSVERVGYPTRLVAVETDGPQHFSDEAQRKRDVKKNRILEKLSIPLIRVSHVGQLQARLEALPPVLWEGATAPLHPTIFIKLDQAAKSKFPFNFSFKSAKAKAKARQTKAKSRSRN